MKSLTQNKITSYNSLEDRKGDQVLWHGYINTKGEVVTARYFSQFDREQIKTIKGAVKIIDPFTAINKQEADEYARAKYKEV
jgi:hypothetical protein